MENIVEILVEKDRYWLEKDFAGKHGSKNAETRKEGREKVNPVSGDVALRAQLPLQMLAMRKLTGHTRAGGQKTQSI